jgi:hypothetical protein
MFLIWQRSFKDCGVQDGEAAYQNLQFFCFECMKELFVRFEAEFLLQVMLSDDVFDGFFC